MSIGIQRKESFSFLVKAGVFIALFFCFWSMSSNQVQAASAPSGAPTASASTSQQVLNVTIVDTTNAAANTEYAVYNSTTNKYLDVNGAPSDTFFAQATSSWGNIYATGLATNTAYIFRIVARDSAGHNNPATSTPSTAVYTRVGTPVAPTVAASTTSPYQSLRVTLVAGAGNPATNTTYAIFNNTSGNYISHTDGAGQAAADWQASSTWALFNYASGLATGTPYQFLVVARNGDNLTVATSSGTTLYTYVTTPSAAPTSTPASTQSMTITIVDTANPGTHTKYAIYNTTTATYLAADGSSSASPVFRTTSTWSTITATGLATNTAYQFVVVALNGDNVGPATSSIAAAKYTLANAASAPTVVVSSTEALAFTIVDTQNPAANTTYAVYDNTLGKYINSTTGAGQATPDFKATSTWVLFNYATGLSGNTLHNFKVIARNGNSTWAATSSVDTSNIYTLANTPSSIYGVANSQNQITLYYSGDATTFFAANVTAGTNSGWVASTTTSFVSASLSCGTDYNFKVSGRNGNSVSTSFSSLVTVMTQGGCGGGGNGGGGGGYSAPAPTPTPTTPVVVTETPVVVPVTVVSEVPTAASSDTHIIVAPTDVNALLEGFNLERDTTKETQNQTKIIASLKQFKLTATDDQKTAMTNFVTYGASDATIGLGSGERLALLRDYADTVKRTEINWADIERITTGQKPVDRNLTSEQAQVSKVLALFKKISGHTPNFQNSAEDLAWNTMMYRIRFDRDLTKEAAGIKLFKQKIGRTPTTPLDWATVRALGYAL